MFPLSTVLFPYAELPLHVFEPRYQALVADVLAGDRTFGTVLIRAGSEVGGGDRRCDVGTLLNVQMTVPFDDGRQLVVTRGIERIRVVEWLDDDPYPQAIIEPYPCPEIHDGELLKRATSAVRRVRMLLSELADGPCCSIEVDLGSEPMAASWMVCALAPLGLLDAQSLLEASDSTARLEMLIRLCRARITDLEMLLSQADQS